MRTILDLLLPLNGTPTKMSMDPKMCTTPIAIVLSLAESQVQALKVDIHTANTPASMEGELNLTAVFAVKSHRNFFVDRSRDFLGYFSTTYRASASCPVDASTATTNAVWRRGYMSA